MTLSCRSILRISALLSAAFVAGCAGVPDRFYTLTPTQQRSGERSSIAMHVLLDLTVPSVVDRSEFVLQNPVGGEVSVLQHERWAAPFADEVLQTLSRDIEARRTDVIVADRRFAGMGTAEIKAQVDIVQVVATRGERVMLEAHWRLTDAKNGMDKVGSERFEATPDGTAYAAIARAVSVCLEALADRIVGGLPATAEPRN